MKITREIRKKTGFRICHNHLSLDYATELFDLGTKEYDALCTALRQLTFEHAVRAGLDLIFTFCYSCPEDNGFIAGLEALVTQGGGSFCLIHLTCGRKELE